MNYLKQVIESLYEDQEIKKFIHKNGLTETDIINNLNALMTQKENNRICLNSSEKCLQDPYGMASRIRFENGKVLLTYYEVLDKNKDKNLERLFFPNITELDDAELFTTYNRANVLKETIRFTKEYKRNKFTKGVYIHGKFGTGKSFILQKLAISMSRKGAKVIIAYYPDLVRMIKSSIASRNTEVIINKLKNIDILMLDDVGAETNTNFIRDEVLGPILQYRMDNLLPVCMTSNLNLDELKLHFQDSTTGINIINSERIISRIRYLMVDVFLDDENYRDKK